MQSSTSSSFGKRLAWEEPKDFRKADMKACWKSTFRIISLTAGAAIVFLGIARWFDLGADVAWQLLIAAGGIVIVCLLGMIRVSRSFIKITDKAIVWDCGKRPMVYRFGTVDHCEIGTMLVGGRLYSVLVVALKNSDREIFCVAPSISTQVLRLTLEQRGMKVVTRSDTLSEQALLSEEADPYAKLPGLQQEGNRSDAHGQD